MTTVADLIATKSAATYFDELVAGLTSRGFPVTAWQSGGAGRTLTRVDADALADLRTVVTLICKGGFLDEAEGDWLTLLAYGVFDITRSPAVYMLGDVTLACAATAGPYTITPGALVVSDGTRRWRSTNTSNVTVPSGGVSDPIRVKAESPGDAYNVNGDKITIIVTPASAGLTVDATTGIGWYAVTGDAKETDAALRERCRNRWSTLGRGANLDAYEFNATSAPAAPTITRVRAVPGGGDGTLTIYIAQSSGVATGGQVTAVQAYIDSICPVTDAPTVVAATAVTVQVTGTVTFSSASYNTSAAQAAVNDAITAYILARGFGDTVDLGGIYNAIYAAAPGVVDVDLSFPAGDTVLTASQVGAPGTITITYAP